MDVPTAIWRSDLLGIYVEIRGGQVEAVEGIPPMTTVYVFNHDVAEKDDESNGGPMRLSRTLDAELVSVTEYHGPRDRQALGRFIQNAVVR